MHSSVIISMMLLAATLQYAKALVIQNSSRRACYSSSTTTRLYANSNNSENNDDDVHGKHYNIKGNGQQSIVKMQTNTGHTIQTDVPHKMGGKDTAPQPVNIYLPH